MWYRSPFWGYFYSFPTCCETFFTEYQLWPPLSQFSQKQSTFFENGPLKAKYVLNYVPNRINLITDKIFHLGWNEEIFYTKHFFTWQKLFFDWFWDSFCKHMFQISSLVAMKSGPANGPTSVGAKAIKISSVLDELSDRKSAIAIDFNLIFMKRKITFNELKRTQKRIEKSNFSKKILKMFFHPSRQFWYLTLKLNPNAPNF